MLIKYFRHDIILIVSLQALKYRYASKLAGNNGSDGNGFIAHQRLTLSKNDKILVRQLIQSLAEKSSGNK